MGGQVNQPIRTIATRQPAPPPIRTREPTQAERALREALRQDRLYHGYSMAQRVGIYPA